MRVIVDNWYEYTEEDKRILEQIKKKFAGDKMPKLLMPERSKEYIVEFPNLGKYYVKIREDLFDWKYVEFEFLSSKSEKQIWIYLAKGENEIGCCYFSFYNFEFDGSKTLSMRFSNCDTNKESITNWHSIQHDYDYIMNDRKNKRYMERKISDPENFGNTLVEKAFSNFNLLIEGKVKDWFDKWFSELKSFLEI